MKILSNKKYHELLLKSCKGMFGAVTDDMLLRSNAFLAKEKEQLQDELQRKDNNWNELKEWLKEQFDIYLGIDKLDDTRISCQLLRVLDKINELERKNEKQN